MNSLSQSSIIAASLVIAFIVFITVRGELPGYLAVLGIEPGSGSTASTATGAVGRTAANFGSGSGLGVNINLGSGTVGVGFPLPGGGSGGVIFG